ncbi:hypothetical protein ABPG72_008853 [Tetrahymena utriculariae]
MKYSQYLIILGQIYSTKSTCSRNTKEQHKAFEIYYMNGITQAAIWIIEVQNFTAETLAMIAHIGIITYYQQISYIYYKALVILQNEEIRRQLLLKKDLALEMLDLERDKQFLQQKGSNNSNHSHQIQQTNSIYQSHRYKNMKTLNEYTKNYDLSYYDQKLECTVSDFSILK